MNKFVVFAALIAVALASSSSSSAAQSSSASPVPVEPFTEMKTFVSVIECASHFNISAAGEDDEEEPSVQEYWFFYDTQFPMKFVLKTVGGDQYALIRCDLANASGFCYAQGTDEESSEECQSDYVAFEDAFYAVLGVIVGIDYDPAEYPKDFDCPDGSKDCKIYCNTDDTCAIADAKGRTVSLYSADEKKFYFNITYYDGDFDASVFAMEDCDGTMLSVPTNPCPAPAPSGSSTASSAASSSSSSTTSSATSSTNSSSVPVEPSSSSAGPETRTYIPVVECASHFNVSTLNETETGVVGEPIVEEYWLYFNEQAPMKSVILTSSPERTLLVRCDLPNATGACYGQGTDDESSEQCRSGYATFDEAMIVVAGVFVTINYSITEYPKNFDCPDGSKACMLFCNEQGSCAIADTKGHIVSVYSEDEEKYYFNVTYFDADFDASVFALEDCNGTKLSVPTNPCGSAPSGSSTSTSNSTSAASFVQVAYTVVLAALLVALF